MFTRGVIGGDNKDSHGLVIIVKTVSLLLKSSKKKHDFKIEIVSFTFQCSKPISNFQFLNFLLLSRWRFPVARVLVFVDVKVVRGRR